MGVCTSKTDLGPCLKTIFLPRGYGQKDHSRVLCQEGASGVTPNLITLLAASPHAPKTAGFHAAVILRFRHTQPFPFLGMNSRSQGINTSLPGTRLAMWSRGLENDQRTRTVQLSLNSVNTLLFAYLRPNGFNGGN